MQCYLIRHGEILSNVKKIYVGTSQEELTARGKEQVRLLAGDLQERGIRILYTSPIRRAVQTAEILADYLGSPIIMENDLREMALGPLEGLSYEQVIMQFPEVWEIWNHTPAEMNLEGMEPLREVQRRIITLMEKLFISHADETIAAVTHLAVLRCTLLWSMGRPLNDYRKIDIPNASGFLFEAKADKLERRLKLTLVEEIHPSHSSAKTSAGRS